MKQTFLRFFLKLRRALTFFIEGWNSEDWDFDYTLRLMSFKMKRTLKLLEEDIFSAFDGKAIKSLKLAIKLIEGQLHRDEMYEIQRARKPFSDTLYTRVFTDGKWFGTVKHIARTTPESKSEGRKAYDYYIANRNKIEKRRNLLFKIMSKYSSSWWN